MAPRTQELQYWRMTIADDIGAAELCTGRYCANRVWPEKMPERPGTIVKETDQRHSGFHPALVPGLLARLLRLTRSASAGK